MAGTVVIEKQGTVSIIRMNLPDKLNCLEPVFRDDFKACLQAFADDAESRAAILTGNGRAFCAGGDLAELGDGMTAVHGVKHMKGCNDITLMLAGIPKPIIAAVNGAAAGAGFSIAMACDMVIASTAASFMQAFTKVGLVPDMGSLYYLPRVVGMHRAKELIWTAKRIKAEEAMQMGMLNKLVAPDELEGQAMALAQELAAGPAFAIGLSKTLLSRSLENTLQDMMQYEGLAQPICMQSEDHQEGVKAFYEKRTPVFLGK